MWYRWYKQGGEIKCTFATWQVFLKYLHQKWKQWTRNFNGKLRFRDIGFYFHLYTAILDLQNNIPQITVSGWIDQFTSLRYLLNWYTVHRLSVQVFTSHFRSKIKRQKSQLHCAEGCGSGGGCVIVLQSNGPAYNDHTQTDKYKAKDALNVPPENIHKTPRRALNYRCWTSVSIAYTCIFVRFLFQCLWIVSGP